MSFFSIYILPLIIFISIVIILFGSILIYLKIAKNRSGLRKFLSLLERLFKKIDTVSDDALNVGVSKPKKREK